MSSMPITRGVRSRGADPIEEPPSSSEKEDRLDIISLGSEEMALLILENLNPADLANCSKVSRKWKPLADDDYLWKKFIEDKKIGIPIGTSVKQFIAAQCSIGAIFCISHEEVMQRLEVFFQNLSCNQSGNFKVITSGKEEGEFSIEDYYRKAEKELTKTCFLISEKKDEDTFQTITRHSSVFDLTVSLKTHTGSALSKNEAKYVEIFNKAVKKWMGKRRRRNFYRFFIRTCIEIAAMRFVIELLRGNVNFHEIDAAIGEITLKIMLLFNMIIRYVNF